MVLDKGGEKKKASGSARETEDRGQVTNQLQLLGRRARDSSREIFKAGKIVAVRGSYCVHRVRVGPQRRVEGWHTNLLIEAQWQTAMTEKSESIGRDEQVVAASSPMRGEKYRDEVGLGRSDSDDLPNELAGAMVPLRGSSSKRGETLKKACVEP